MRLGERIKQLRTERGYTLMFMQDIGIDLSVSYLSDIERGRTMPSLESLVKCANAFDMTVQELIAPVDFGERARYRTPLPFED